MNDGFRRFIRTLRYMHAPFKGGHELLSPRIVTSGWQKIFWQVLHRLFRFFAFDLNSSAHTPTGFIHMQCMPLSNVRDGITNYTLHVRVNITILGA